MASLHLAGLVGSVRKDSYNKNLLLAASELLPEDVSLDIIPIGDLPFYNQDLETSGVPEVVHAFRRRIAQADGLIIATPEYNYSTTGVLKNALEWASRPVGASALAGKPIALMGATASLWGTVRAQLALRQIFAGTNNPVVNRPEILVAMAQSKFDGEGRLTDPQTLTLLDQSMHSFVAYLRAARPAEAAAR